MSVKRKYGEVEQDPNEVSDKNGKMPKAEVSTDQQQPDDDQQQSNSNNFQPYTPGSSSAPPPLNPELEDCPGLLALPRGKWVSYAHEISMPKATPSSSLCSWSLTHPNSSLTTTSIQ